MGSSRDLSQHFCRIGVTIHRSSDQTNDLNLIGMLELQHARRGFVMRSLRYLAVLCVLLLPAAYSHAQISFGIGIGAPVYAPPACAYGYYGYAPYGCAPYGYYGPQWFSGGAFIGAGPWYRGGYGYGRGWYGDGDGWRGRGDYGGRGGWGRERGGFNRGRGGYGHNVRGGGNFRGGRGGGFHGGGGGGRGGGRR